MKEIAPVMNCKEITPALPLRLGLITRMKHVSNVASRNECNCFHLCRQQRVLPARAAASAALLIWCGGRFEAGAGVGYG